MAKDGGWGLLLLFVVFDEDPSDDGMASITVAGVESGWFLFLRLWYIVACCGFVLCSIVVLLFVVALCGRRQIK